jgi:hypothetical protein
LSIYPPPHLLPQLKTIQEGLEPLPFERWQLSAQTVLAGSSQCPNGLENILKVGKDQGELGAITSSSDPILVPLFLLGQGWEDGSAG